MGKKCRKHEPKRSKLVEIGYTRVQFRAPRVCSLVAQSDAASHYSACLVHPHCPVTVSPPITCYPVKRAFLVGNG